MNIVISTAKTKQAAEIIRLIRASITQLCAADHANQAEDLAEWLNNKTIQNMQNWLVDSNKTFLIAQISNQIVGIGSANNKGRILMNYVHPNFRYQGISKTIMAHLEQHLHSLGLTQATLESSKTAHKFYQSTGWQRVKTNDNKIEMNKYL